MATEDNIKLKEEIKSDSSSTSDSEVSVYSSRFDPVKVLYSTKTVIPVTSAPLYDNISQFENSLSQKDVVPVGHSTLVKAREEKKLEAKREKEREIEEKNRQRFSEYQRPTVVPRIQKIGKNVLTRMGLADGPLAVLKDCVDQGIRIKVTTRSGHGIRGVLHATLVAFDKQWNLALEDVLEIWKRKQKNKRKIPPSLGTPVPKGSAAAISPVPVVTETPIGNGVLECTRHIPQLMVRGEHVVIINIVER